MNPSPPPPLNPAPLGVLRILSLAKNQYLLELVFNGFLMDFGSLFDSLFHDISMFSASLFRALVCMFFIECPFIFGSLLLAGHTFYLGKTYDSATSTLTENDQKINKNYLLFDLVLG